MDLLVCQANQLERTFPEIPDLPTFCEEAAMRIEYTDKMDEALAMHMFIVSISFPATYFRLNF